MICAFTVIPLAYYAISLRQHPEIGFSEFWWKTVTWALAERTDLVPLGACSASTWWPACCIGCHPTCSIRSTACRCTAAAGRRCSSCSCLRSPPRSTFPARIHFGAGSWFEFGPFSVQHGRVLLYASLFLFRRRHRRREFRSRAAGGGRPDGEGQLGLDDR